MIPRDRRSGGLFAAALWFGTCAPAAEAQEFGVVPQPQCTCSDIASSPAASINSMTRRPYTALRPVAELDLHGDLVVEIHEGLLNRIVGRSDQRQSDVRDFVLGADVYGTETTHTSVHIDLQPSDDGVALYLVLNGENRSHTVGYTPQAAVRTLGQHSFVARKRIVHEGRLFRTERPQVDVSPHNQTLGADTVVSGVPFLGDVASSIAYQAAEAQKAQGEAIAAQKIRDGVGSQFNRQVDEQLALLNRGWLETIAPQLHTSGFGGIGITAQSTDEWARYAVRIAGAKASRRVPQGSAKPTPAGQVTARRVDASAAAAEVDPSAVGRLVIRESLIQSLVDRLGLAGLTVKASDFSREVAIAITVVKVLQQYGLAFEQVPPEALAALQSLEIRFADRNPARILFADDELTVQVRAALAVPPLIDLPLMQIDLRYRIDDAGGDQIALVPAGVLFRPVSDDAAGLGPLAPLLESQAAAALPSIQLPRTVRVPIPTAAPLDLSIDRLEARDGTLSLTVR